MNRQALIDRISDTFCVEPDYLWSKSSDAAVFRHAVSQKWFGLLMSVSPQSLRIPGDARIDILNVKCDPLLNGSLRQRPGFFPAYHMNKELWISIILNEVSDDDVMELVCSSYDLTSSTKDLNNATQPITKAQNYHELDRHYVPKRKLEDLLS